MVLILLASPALAYRPFDSTDAAVAAQGEIEIECGPVGYAIEGRDRFVVVPAAIFNVGLPDRWEVVIEGKIFLQLNAPPLTARQRVEDSALSLKRVLRPGTQHEQRGPSVASRSRRRCCCRRHRVNMASVRHSPASSRSGGGARRCT